MFFIPGFLISLVTFPGVIVHELAHQLFCRVMGIPVYTVKYFQLKNPCGYVIHEASDKPHVNFVISVGPFFINTILGSIIVFPAAMEFVKFGSLTEPMSLITAWLGLSVLMHAFPSTGDAKALNTTVLKNKSIGILPKFLVAPVIGMIYVGAFGSVVWLDFAYALAVSALLPIIIAPLFV